MGIHHEDRFSSQIVGRKRDERYLQNIPYHLTGRDLSHCKDEVESCGLLNSTGPLQRGIAPWSTRKTAVTTAVSAPYYLIGSHGWQSSRP